jgi:hypothetical protein
VSTQRDCGSRTHSKKVSPWYECARIYNDLLAARFSKLATDRGIAVLVSVLHVQETDDERHAHKNKKKQKGIIWLCIEIVMIICGDFV